MLLQQHGLHDLRAPQHPCAHANMHMQLQNVPVPVPAGHDGFRKFRKMPAGRKPYFVRQRFVFLNIT